MADLRSQENRRPLPTLDALSDDPRPRSSKRLSEQPGVYRVRVDDYRIIDEIEDRERLLSITLVGHRRDVYR